VVQTDIHRRSRSAASFIAHTAIQPRTENRTRKLQVKSTVWIVCEAVLHAPKPDHFRLEGHEHEPLTPVLQQLFARC
jgi:hypothetical protein